MHYKSNYATVSEAINNLRAKGFTTDFNLEENCIVCQAENFELEDLVIVGLYRYGGNSDPYDEATVYAIESKSGLKGILVSGYGISSDTRSNMVLERIRIRK